jgi:hypothetical protein
MTSLNADESKKKATFDFYNAFLAVVYGLLVSKGLEYVVIFTSDHPTHQWESIDALLFLGTFLTSLHFWFVCATVDDLSTDFYQIFVGSRTSFLGLLILVDVLVATAFAGLLLAMFDAVPKHPFFKWFWLSGALSLVYDLYSRILIWRARRKYGRNNYTIEKYGGRINSWSKKDLIFVAASGLMYLNILRNIVQNSITLGLIFALFTLGLLLMDVCSFQRDGRNIFAAVHTRDAPDAHTQGSSERR